MPAGSILSGPFIAARYLANVPNLQPVCLLSRDSGGNSYTPHSWIGRNLPSDQLAHLMTDVVTSSRTKSVSVIRSAAAASAYSYTYPPTSVSIYQDVAVPSVMPKEQDAFYCMFGTSPQVWGLWSIKTLNSQFDMWVFDAQTTWQRDVVPIAALPTSLPAGVAGTPYSQSAATTGGYGTLAYSVLSGTLPDGLTLGASTGLVSGTPTTPGTFTFTIKAIDGGLFYVKQAYSVTITT